MNGSSRDGLLASRATTSSTVGAGADTMAGGLGNDTYVVDNVGDVVIENASEGTDTVLAAISYTLGANVENLTLTGSANINGTGNALANILTGNSGDNVLDGGAGADTMAGGLGNDTYVVDNVGDVVIENANEGTDTVLAAITYTLGANVENLTLTGPATSTAPATPSPTASPVTPATTSSTAVPAPTPWRAALGNDTYVVDNIGDVVIENASEGTDTVLAAISYTLGANVENLTLTGPPTSTAPATRLPTASSATPATTSSTGLAPTPWRAGSATTPTWSTMSATW